MGHPAGFERCRCGALGCLCSDERLSCEAQDRFGIAAKYCGGRMTLKMTLIRALLSVPLFCVLVAPQSKGQSSATVPPSVTSAPSTPPQTTSFGRITVPEISPGILEGYLEREALPDSVALVPQVPTPGTAAYALDEAVSRANLALRGSQRWDLATMDADLTFPQVTGSFSCAVGVPITEAETPHLYMLLRRSFTDAALSTSAAKNHYKRARPFVENKQSTCTPRQEDALMKDGSYPVGTHCDRMGVGTDSDGDCSQPNGCNSGAWSCVWR